VLLSNSLYLDPSAGIGRTGTFIVIYSAIEEFDAHKGFGESGDVMIVPRSTRRC
jgi:protein tyrosine phosphatase